MPRKKIDFETVRDIGLALLDVKDATTPRGFALKLKGRLLACEALNKSAEPGSLMVRIGSDERNLLLASEPDVFYVTDHYAGHPAVLVRLSAISRAALRNVLERAWRFVSEK